MPDGPGSLVFLVGLGVWACYALGADEDDEVGVRRLTWASFGLVGLAIAVEGLMTWAGWW